MGTFEYINMGAVQNKNKWKKRIDLKGHSGRWPFCFSTMGRHLGVNRQRSTACANCTVSLFDQVLCYSFINTPNKWERLGTRCSTTNAHSVICSFSDWPRKLSICRQICPHGGKTKWPATAMSFLNISFSFTYFYFVLLPYLCIQMCPYPSTSYLQTIYFVRKEKAKLRLNDQSWNNLG